MVENVNNACFQHYGTLPGEDEYGKNLREMLLHPATETAGFFCDTHRVLLIPQEGMSAVEVRLGQTSDLFYLDKPVLLKRRVAFRLFAMNISSSVKVFVPWDAEISRTEEKTEKPELTLEPGVRIERIYTIFRQEKAGGFFFHGEKHDPYELTLVEKGRLHCVAGGQEYTVGPGEVLLFLPQQWHMQYADLEENVSFCTFSFDLFCRQAPMMAGQVYRANEKMLESMKRMMESQIYPETQDADRMILLLTELMMEMRKMAMETGGQRRPDSYNPLVEKALRYISDHLHQHLSVAHVASAVNVSAPYLAVLFRKYLHQAPAETIRMMKMVEGRKLIEERSMNVQETAQTLGFATPQHFSRCFKEYFGFTPKACGKRKK